MVLGARHAIRIRMLVFIEVEKNKKIPSWTHLNDQIWSIDSNVVCTILSQTAADVKLVSNDTIFIPIDHIWLSTAHQMTADR